MVNYFTILFMVESKYIYRYEALGTFIINFLFFSLITVNNQLRLLSPFHLALVPPAAYYVVYLLFKDKCRTHFNPAFTFSFYITAQCSLKEFLYTSVAQLGGMAAGTLGAILLFSNSMLKLELSERLIDFQFTDIPRLQITIILLFFTTFLTGAVYFYSFCCRKSAPSEIEVKNVLPFCVTLFLANLITLPITGTGIHPLRLLVLAFLKKPFEEYGLYLFICILGTVCGALSYYKYLHHRTK